jgi:large subunit ribosomal protein L23
MNTNIIIKPLITEQSMKSVDGGKYSFAVARFASKTAIKAAIKKLFGVNVVSVATSVVKGKTKRVGAKRQEIKQSLWKKAIVTVKKGEKIGIFEPGGEEPKK